jgi:hypothetical protein
MILVESIAMKGQSKQKGNCTFFSLMQTLKTQGQLSSGNLKLTGIDESILVSQTSSTGLAGFCSHLQCPSDK